jgi:hypothetical protein
MISKESSKTSSFLALSSKAASRPMMQASYSAVLLVHSNSNLVEIGYCLFSGEITTAPALFPDTFTALSK